MVTNDSVFFSMYTKEQLSKYRTAFWTKFGQYMKPVQGASGLQVNWINYKTGIRQVYFKMDAGLQSASIAIELRHTDDTDRIECYGRFESLQKILEEVTGQQWQWEPHATNEHNQPMSRISRQLQAVSITNESDWPAIISFLKPGIMQLDAFWDLVKDGFD